MSDGTYFRYDGKHSASFFGSLRLLRFDRENRASVSAYAPQLHLSKPSNQPRFFHNGITFEDAPTAQFSFISEQELTLLDRACCLEWLFGRKSFKKFELDSVPGYYYRCVFTESELIFVNGKCHGFIMTAVFDSPYAYGEPTIHTFTHDGSAAPLIAEVKNASSIIDGYVFPKIDFAVNSASYVSGFANVILRIVNLTDDPSKARPLVIKDTRTLYNSTISIDNELKLIEEKDGKNVMNHFNKRWLRITKTQYADTGSSEVSAYEMNKLEMNFNGTMRIKIPNYKMIGYEEG